MYYTPAIALRMRKWFFMAADLQRTFHVTYDGLNGHTDNKCKHPAMYVVSPFSYYEVWAGRHTLVTDLPGEDFVHDGTLYHRDLFGCYRRDTPLLAWHSISDEVFYHYKP